MRLHRLQLRAFGPFAGSQDIDFDSLARAGLFLLHGPTGAGKTSVLDAVCYALYAAVPGARQQAQGAGLRSDHAVGPERTEVRLEFSVAGRRLEITRCPAWERPKRRGKGTTTERAVSELREHDGTSWQALSRSHQEIGEEILQLIGMSREQFCQVVLLPQGDFARFLRADAEARGKLLGKLFSTGRFAAVEQELAERRRLALTAVREGDEQLLADAHRIEQAGGRSVELPLPDGRAGDPGLPEDVLSWAATVRSTARERLESAVGALGLARTRHQEARQHLADSEELARQQHRARQAASSLALLDERAEQRRQAEEGLARGRRAERVAPVAEHRDTAAVEQRRTAGTEAAMRRALPPEYAEQSAAGLAEAARRTATELGALGAARRAEERLAGLDEERRGLTQQEEADDAALREATTWLDGHEERRAELGDRVQQALEAGVLAEGLAARTDDAARLAAAARREDDLRGRLPAAEEELRAARDRSGERREEWLRLKEIRLQHFAAELAGQLRPGEDCAVCGSTEHPRPAVRTEGHVDGEAEQAALASHQHAETVREAAARTLAGLRDAHAAAVEQSGGTTPHEAIEEHRRLGQELSAARSRAAGAHAAREALNAEEREHRLRAGSRQQAAERSAARASLRDALAREEESLREVLRAAGAEGGRAAERAAELERRTELLTDAAEAVRSAAEAARVMKEADAALAHESFRAGFSTPEEAVAALLTDEQHRTLQRLLDDWAAESAAARAVLAEAEIADAQLRPPADCEAARTGSAATEGRLQDAVAAAESAAERCREIDRLSAGATARARRTAPLREEYDRVARMASLAAGTSAANERRMRLESYVLAARLEQVAAAATGRLHRMSGGRYALVHSDGRTGRGRSGLGLHVVDAWTGRERDTSSLSGGETFFASLALALGLADVVTEEAGGVRLDTLFIDEGFGSLDEQSLDEVMDVLDSLRESERSVGIVSHVADLRRRVPVQLEVLKDRAGSRVRIRGAS